MKKLHLTLTGISIGALFIGVIALQSPAVEANGKINPLPTPTPNIDRLKQSRAGIPKAKIKPNKPDNFEWEGETTEVKKTNPPAAPSAKLRRKRKH